MSLPWDLEDWLTDAGDRVVRLLTFNPDAALTGREKLIYEIWLLDTEARNGGLSQYFANAGIAQWTTCAALASGALPSFPAFAERVAAMLQQHSDPYLAILGGDGDNLWDDHQEAVVSELRTVATSDR